MPFPVCSEARSQSFIWRGFIWNGDLWKVKRLCRCRPGVGLSWQWVDGWVCAQTALRVFDSNRIAMELMSHSLLISLFLFLHFSSCFYPDASRKVGLVTYRFSHSHRDQHFLWSISTAAFTAVSQVPSSRRFQGCFGGRFEVFFTPTSAANCRVNDRLLHEATLFADRDSVAGLLDIVSRSQGELVLRSSILH